MALTGQGMNSPRSLLLPLLAAALICPAFAGGWSDDYKASLATATKERKNVLLDFTGSDWCGWCIRLKRETFDQPAFKEYADKNLVLVEIEGPVIRRDGLPKRIPVIRAPAESASP